MTDIPVAIQTGLRYIRSIQKADGGFEALASPSLDLSLKVRVQPTIFPTVLILDNLHGISESLSICNKAADYVRSQMSAQGSWNYWGIQSSNLRSEPYPDDLDDTACALAALTRHNPTLIRGTQLGQFARLLIASEESVGGPYNTWLIDGQASPQWRQIDIAVNANIGYALSLHDASTSGLMGYLDDKIAANDLASAYYQGIIPVLYFLARWYRGMQLTTLRAIVLKKLRTSTAHSSLEQALLLSAASWLELPVEVCRPLTERLARQSTDGYWPARALYPEPMYGGQQHYAGSRVLTTSFAVQALCLQQARTLPKSAVVPKSFDPMPLAIVKLTNNTALIPNSYLRRQYIASLRKISAGKNGEQIASAASLVARTTSIKLTKSTEAHLNAASLNGWLAYAIYDDFLDGGGKPAKLNVANIALRRSYAHFMQALPDCPEFKLLIMRAFDTMDSANAWELQHARVAITSHTLRIIRLPDYQDLQQLSERSQGHSLAASGVLLAAYGSLDHPCVMAMQRFFEHFLIARQLHDDAHDWQEDLSAGHLSAVVVMLLGATPCKINLVTDLERLQRRFWEETIDEVAVQMREQFTLARQELLICQDYLNIAFFEGWLLALERGLHMALDGREQALQFMQAYEGAYAN